MATKDVIYNKRKELGLTMKQVADSVGVSEGTVSRWESGEIENIRNDKLPKLAEVLGITMKQLLGFDDGVFEFWKLPAPDGYVERSKYDLALDKLQEARDEILSLNGEIHDLEEKLDVKERTDKVSIETKEKIKYIEIHFS